MLVGLIHVLTLSEETKRQIAKMPRWKRFFVWPIDKHIAPKDPVK